MQRTVLSNKDVEFLRKTPELHEPTDELYGRRLEVMGLVGYDQAQAAALEADSYKTRLIKYIPSEVVAVYLALDALIRSGQPAGSLWLWLAFLVGLVGVPLYLWRLQKVRKIKQLLISTTAFVVWVLAIGGPFVAASWYDPMYGGVVLIAFTFFAPIIEA